jgi:hypothetical protein
MAIMCLRLPREREEKKIAPAMGRPIFATLEKGKKKYYVIVMMVVS